MDNNLDTNNLVGKSYNFEDGSVIEVIEIKNRDDGPWIHYNTTFRGCLPKKQVCPVNEFIGHFGHLFKE